MLIFLSGCHGVGKTTLVNNINIDRPLVKFTNSDMINFEGQGPKQMIERYNIMFSIFDNMPTNMDVIIDRSPMDFPVYNNIALEQFPEYVESVEIMQENLMKRYYDLGPVVTIMITDDIDLIFERIKKRSRLGFNEENEKFTRRVYNSFESMINWGTEIIDCPLPDAKKYIEKLLFKV